MGETARENGFCQSVAMSWFTGKLPGYAPVPPTDETTSMMESQDQNPAGSTSLKDVVQGKAAAMKDSFRGMANKIPGVQLEPAEPPPPPSMFDGVQSEMDEMCSLTYKQRLIGFAICAAIGFMISFGSFLRFAKALGGNPVPFAKAYSLGNIVSLCATGFLVGPCKQLQNITEGSRMLCSICYIGSIVGTLFLCLTKYQIPAKNLLILVLAVAQFIAWAHYCCSYIPFGRTMLNSGVSKVTSLITG